MRFATFSASPQSNVQHDDGDPQRFGRQGRALETIDQQIAAIALARQAAVDADHRNVGGRDAAMRRAVAGEPIG
jgi:hypothetical protein